MTPDDVIKSFAADCLNLSIDRWPDKENRGSEDIDAVAKNFAIEHTSIDVVDGMRQRNDWFMKAAGDLEAELNPSMQFRLRINFDYESIDKGQDWNEIKNAIRDWVINQSASLSEGFQVLRIPNVPFDLRIEKASDEAPLLVFSRSFKQAQETLESSIGPLMQRKARKLSAYTKSGMTGILLIQSEDISFMNRVRLAEAVAKAFPDALPDGIDQVWYADATIPQNLEFHNITPSIT
jgi:hypothetical protein